jgi:hypothetical protein
MDHTQAYAIRDGMFRDMGLVKGAIAWGQLLVDDPSVYNAVHGREIYEGVRLMNPGTDAAIVTDKYMRRTQAATADYVRGIQNPRRDPKTAALNAAGKYKNNMQKALNENRYEAGIRNYDVADAVRIATEDGGAAYASGIQKRQGKIGAMHARLMPKLGAISQAIQQMPQDSEGARDQRMIANVRMLRELKGKV